MPRVVGVRLRHCGQFYDFDAGDLDLAPGDWVIVDTARGQDVGQVVFPPCEVPAEQLTNALKVVERRATGSDLQRMQRSREREGAALARARAMVAEKNLPMRLIAAEYTYNGRSLTIYFSSEKRVDFREMVKGLAREFRARIELRQIGARDEARLLGGYGPCGRPLCCATFLTDFLRISVRMAKEQDLPLSPMKISGVCGRLLCCLSYECDQYQQIKSELPGVGEEVTTLRGRGTVTAVNVPRETVTVELRAGVSVEANAAELAQAGRWESEGRLAADQPTCRDLPLVPAEEPAKPQAAARPAHPDQEEERGGRRRQRRRKKADGPGPAAARPGPQALQAPQPRREPERRPMQPSVPAARSGPQGSLGRSGPPRRRRPRRGPRTPSSPEK